jgi:hypothetical protein
VRLTIPIMPVIIMPPIQAMVITKPPIITAITGVMATVIIPLLGLAMVTVGAIGVVIRYMDGIMVVAMEGGTAEVDGMAAVLEGDFTAVIDKKIKFYPVS